MLLGVGLRQTTSDVSPAAQALDSRSATGEKALNLIVWAGYAEDGSTDPAYDWVHPFEDQTGCDVKSKIGSTSDEMFQLMQHRRVRRRVGLGRRQRAPDRRRRRGAGQHRR